METRIKISGEHIYKRPLNNQCAPNEEISFEVVKNRGDFFTDFWLEFDGIGIHLTKSDMIKMLRFLTDEREIKDSPPVFNWDGEKYSPV